MDTLSSRWKQTRQFGSKFSSVWIKLQQFFLFKLMDLSMKLKGRASSCESCFNSTGSKLNNFDKCWMFARLTHVHKTTGLLKYVDLLHRMFFSFSCLVLSQGDHPVNADRSINPMVHSICNVSFLSNESRDRTCGKVLLGLSWFALRICANNIFLVP